MNSTADAAQPEVTKFRGKLVAGIMLVVSGLTILGLYAAHRSVAGDALRDLRHDFEAQLSALHDVQNLRHAALVERCRVLVSNPRLHAALEDNALDLLYPTAKDELRELMQNDESAPDPAHRVLRARFYRFLDQSGAVLPGSDPRDAGSLNEQAESALSLKTLPTTPQTGYLPHGSGLDSVDEIIAIPIFSTETSEVISALVVGFKPLQMPGNGARANMKSGLWVDGSVYLPTLPKDAYPSIATVVSSAINTSAPDQGNAEITVDGAPQLLFYQRINPASVFRPGYEVCVYPLADYAAHQRRLLWQIGGAGASLLLVGLIASHFIAGRLAVPVEQLAVDSVQNRMERRRAEAALVSTSEELERTARYSADASHQLKSPVAVLRAGLESLLARDDFKPEVYDELSAMLHQTYRLTGVIDDLLLLARMDAGHLQIQSSAINLTELIDEWLDDLSAMPEAGDVRIEREIPNELLIAGERRYASLIVQNLLENARKYNRPGGLIRIQTETKGNQVAIRIGNTGLSIPLRDQANLFTRFQRGSGGGNVAGHGLGLNLARELARLHRGDLRLIESRNDWTEFEVRFRAVRGKTVSET